jgi:GNAT superfamily N-acetyltransferase
MRIEELGPPDAERVFDAVLALMADMEDETLEAVGARRAATIALWRERPAGMCALAACGDDGEILGIATLTEAYALYACGRFGIVSELYVRPAERSSGVGAALLDAARAYGERRGWTRLELTAGDSAAVERRMRFYDRNGWIRTGVRLKLPIDS